MITPEDFNAIGDGIADDFDALQNAFNSSGVVTLGGGRTYRAIVTPAKQDTGLFLKSGTIVVTNGSRINLECSGNVYGIRMQSDTHLVGNGKIALMLSSGLGSLQYLYHSIISLGAAYGEVTNVNNLGPYVMASDWSISGVELSTVKPDGAHIGGIGGLYNGHISDIKVSSTNIANGAVNFDWGTVGVPGTIPQNRANWQNGSFYTVHPNNIVIERVKIGNMFKATAEPIRLSGCSAITVRDIHIGGCGYAGISHYGGDFGYEFCHDYPSRYLAFMGTSIRDVKIDVCNGCPAMRIDCLADNIQREVGYTPLSNPVYETNLLIDGLSAYGGGSAPGFSIGAMTGGIIQRARLSFFNRGWALNGVVNRMLISDSVLYGTNSSAALFSGTTSGVTQVRLVLEN